MTYRPLADEIRPQTLDEVVGQKHILGDGGLLRRIIEGGNIPNLVFYGPSGTGKTTVANLIAKRTHRPLHRLNATTASISDIKEIIGEIGTMLAPDGVLLYLDEIQYFNKKQQQSLLEFMENGKITLIASTTENPYFYVYNAVLSRSTVFEFKPLSATDVLPAVERGIRLMGERLEGEVVCEDGVKEHIASACGGDVRKAMNAIELLLNSAKREQGKLLVTLDDAQTVAQRPAEGTVAADGHNSVQAQQLTGSNGLLPALRLHELCAAGCIEDGSSLIDNMADAGAVHGNEVAVNQSTPASANADALNSPAYRRTDHSTHRCVHAGRIAAAGQDSDPLYLTFHGWNPPYFLLSPVGLFCEKLCRFIMSLEKRNVKKSCGAEKKTVYFCQRAKNKVRKNLWENFLFSC